MFNGKLKECLAYFFEDANFGKNLWNSYPYLVLENSKFETETSKLRGARAVRSDCKEAQKSRHESTTLKRKYYNCIIGRLLLHTFFCFSAGESFRSSKSCVMELIDGYVKKAKAPTRNAS